MKTNIRILTVLRGFRDKPSNRGAVTRINLEGRYLEKAGFYEGATVAVLVEPNRLVISTEPKYQDEKYYREILDLSRMDNKPGDVIMQYKDRMGRWRQEVLRTVPEGPFYKIMSTPLKISELASGDLIEVEEEFGHLFYSHLVQRGPNVTVQVRVRDRYAVPQLLRVAELMGLEVAHRQGNRIVLNIPISSVHKPELVWLLDHGKKNGYWDYAM